MTTEPPNPQTAAKYVGETTAQRRKRIEVEAKARPPEPVMTTKHNAQGIVAGEKK